MKKARVSALANVSGDVFEIGFGTGLNLPHYPAGVKKIVTADPNPGMAQLARRQIAESGIEVDLRILNGESLPIEDNSFDSVVCTWTLCSIPNVGQALREIRRIMRPEGRFYFVEHGLADDPGVRKWQDRLTPLQRKIGDGCHFNRNIKELIADQGFRFEKLDNFYMKKAPRVAGYMYQGIAVKA